jgi:phosphoribosylcarboxyaminoimidazole (NCAIR) mutase
MSVIGVASGASAHRTPSLLTRDTLEAEADLASIVNALGAGPDFTRVANGSHTHAPIVSLLASSGTLEAGRQPQACATPRALHLGQP